MKYNSIYQTFSRLDLAQGSDWETIPTSAQSFDNGNWTGAFTQTPNGDSTDMRIEINWTAGASPLGTPISDPTKVGFSSFDTNVQFGTSNKARIFALAADFVNISQLTVANNLDRLNFGLWVAETDIGSRTSTTAGAYVGGEISTPFAPVTPYNYGLRQMGTITQSGLLVASGQTVTPTVAGIVMVVVLSPNGQILLSKLNPYSDPSGLNRVFSNFTPERANATGTNYQTPTSTNTIKLGCWWGTDKTAQQVGDFYDFTYRLRYAYKELG